MSMWDEITDPLGIIDFAKDQFNSNRDEKNMRSTMDTQMQFAERMSNTAYQRAVTDMEAAGLNPMLAYSQGGAGTPGMPSSPQFGHGSSSGSLHSAAQVQNIRAQTELVRAQAANERSRNVGVQAESSRLAYEFEKVVPLRYQTQGFENAVKDTEAYVAQLEMDFLEGRKGGSRRDESEEDVVRNMERVRALVFKYFEAKFSHLPAQVRSEMAEAVIKELGAKVGRAADRGYESFKRGAGNVGEALGKVTNSAVDAVRGLKHGYERFHSKAQYRRKYEFGDR